VVVVVVAVEVGLGWKHRNIRAGQSAAWDMCGIRNAEKKKKKKKKKKKTAQLSCTNRFTVSI
jgi:hypothetical protein